MNKNEFLQSVEADEELAESAWEKAGGEEARARELLIPERVLLKGRFSDPEAGFYGLFVVDWSLARTSLNNLDAIVLSDDSVEELDPALQTAEFKSKLKHYLSNDSKMGGYTDQLENGLRKLWSNPQSDVREVLDSTEYELFEDLHQSFVADALELGQLSLSASTDERLKVRSASSTSSSDSSSGAEQTMVPCEIEINPVKGLPVSKVSPGDYIYVDPKNVDGQDQNILNQLEKNRDENGLIPAQLTEKRSSSSGKLRLQVKFGDSVHGKISCGKDVSILVPDRTRESHESNNGAIDDLFQNEIFLGAVLGIIALIILGAWYFLF